MQSQQNFWTVYYSGRPGKAIRGLRTSIMRVYCELTSVKNGIYKRLIRYCG